MSRKIYVNHIDISLVQYYKTCANGEILELFPPLTERSDLRSILDFRIPTKPAPDLTGAWKAVLRAVRT
jgi:hypothetical protein